MCGHSEWKEGVDDEYLECTKHDFVFEREGDEAEGLICDDWTSSTVRGNDSVEIVFEESPAEQQEPSAEQQEPSAEQQEPPFKIEKIVLLNEEINSVIVNRMPKLVYEREGNYLVGKDGPFCNVYKHEAPGPNWKAFAGHKFDIPLKDGSVEKAYGQWWHAGYLPGYMSIGANTEEELRKCFVFSAAGVDAAFVNAAIEAGVEQVEYWELDKRYRKGIVS